MVAVSPPTPNLSFPQIEKQCLTQGVWAPGWSLLTSGCFVYTLEDSPNVDTWCFCTLQAPRPLSLMPDGQCILLEHYSGPGGRGPESMPSPTPVSTIWATAWMWLGPSWEAPPPGPSASLAGLTGSPETSGRWSLAAAWGPGRVCGKTVCVLGV